MESGTTFERQLIKLNTVGGSDSVLITAASQMGPRPQIQRLQVAMETLPVPLSSDAGGFFVNSFKFETTKIVKAVAWEGRRGGGGVLLLFIYRPT